MNFLAHAAVARREDDDPRFVLGAVLPDLLPMAGVHLDRDAVPAEVGAGWRAHHRADAAFHACSAFLVGVSALRTDLRTTELTTGPRRAVAHVGWELLLDEAVVDDAEVVATFRAALDEARALTDDRRWHGLLDRFTEFGSSGPDVVAWRAHRAVSRRARLAFDEALVPQVAGVLAAHRDRIVAVAPAVLDEVSR